MTPRAVIFDVGNVLYEWNLRFLYERLIDDDRALEAFLQDVVTLDWHFQHDLGRPFAETSAELIARHPGHAELIRALGPRFGETIQAMPPDMRDLVDALDARGVPLYALTNFSDEFWQPFRAREAWLFDRFRGFVVSGAEGVVKPDPAIYALALDRFGLEAEEAFFTDDRLANVAAASAMGIHVHHFTGAAGLHAALVGHGLLPD